nr:hypothetical protein [Rubrimonas cliftonensis]
MARHGGERQVETRGGGREAAGLDNREKDAQQTQVHRIEGGRGHSV